MASAPTVPLFLDSMNPSGSATFVRCTYFCIDCQMPQAGWSLELNGGSLPILLLGMSGIILSPLEGGSFTNPQQIERLFDAIEQTDGSMVEVNDVLVPAWLLLGREQTRGEVFRADFDFFRTAFAFRSGRLSNEEYLRQTERAHSPLVFSAEETLAFRTWERNIINEVKRDYPKNSELALRWNKGDDDPGGATRNQPPPRDMPPPPNLGNFPFDPTITPWRPTRLNEGLNRGEYA
jgi:hypothetical protein